jgi:YidC/Oxa1 family membrane protein insertase
MEINKRTILWIVFAVSLVVLWNDWMVVQRQAVDVLACSRRPRSRPPRAGPAEGERRCRPPPRTPAPCRAPPPAAAAPAPSRPKIITITTDVYKADIDTAGGVIRRLELLKYRDKVDKTKNQVLFRPMRPGRLYLARPA